MNTESIYTRARAWASSLWDASAPRWTGREGQDRNFRTHVVHPALRDVLLKRFPGGGISLVDLGCGDGAFLDDPENGELLGSEGVYCGVDVSERLLATARARHPEAGAVFVHGDLSDPDTAERILRIGVTWDAALSVFVVQEMPEPVPLLDTLGRILAPGGVALVLTVLPSFGDWLKENGHMPVENDLVPDNEEFPRPWRWAGRYPIVDEPREPFHLPYFHRTVDDYRVAFLDAGFQNIEMREVPDGHVRKALNARGISPFSPSETNVYWPRMIESPSALLIVAVKG